MGGMYVVTVSLCMIVKNEEDVLARCLDSVKDLVDEIIIVDTGSKDRTKEIAHTYTDNVFDFVWIDDFAAARNFAFSKAKCMYCMWLDADDVILPKDQEGFQRLKETLSPETDMVMMKYHTAFDSSGKPTFSYYRERLIANHKGYQWVGAVHEIIPPTGNIYYSDDAAVSHKKLRVQDPDRNLRIFEKLIAQGNVLDARQQFYYARELYYHNQFEKAIQVFNAFLQREDAWVENQIDACTFIFYCRRQMGQKQEALYALFQTHIKGQYIGIKRRPILHEGIRKAVLSNRIVMIIFHTCKCVSAMTNLEITIQPTTTMKKQVTANQMIRHIC